MSSCRVVVPVLLPLFSGVSGPPERSGSKNNKSKQQSFMGWKSYGRYQKHEKKEKSQSQYNVCHMCGNWAWASRWFSSCQKCGAHWHTGPSAWGGDDAGAMGACGDAGATTQLTHDGYERQEEPLEFSQEQRERIEELVQHLGNALGKDASALHALVLPLLPAPAPPPEDRSENGLWKRMRSARVAKYAADNKHRKAQREFDKCQKAQESAKAKLEQQAELLEKAQAEEVAARSLYQSTFPGRDPITGEAGGGVHAPSPGTPGGRAPGAQ